MFTFGVVALFFGAAFFLIAFLTDEALLTDLALEALLVVFLAALTFLVVDFFVDLFVLAGALGIIFNLFFVNLEGNYIYITKK